MLDPAAVGVQPPALALADQQMRKRGLLRRLVPDPCRITQQRLQGPVALQPLNQRLNQRPLMIPHRARSRFSRTRPAAIGSASTPKTPQSAPPKRTTSPSASRGSARTVALSVSTPRVTPLSVRSRRRRAPKLSHKGPTGS
ncbi:hypothetical protein D3C86_1593540 [compost metagenome]